MSDKSLAKQAPSEGCGGTDEQYGYTWTQLDAEVVVTVPMPEGTRAKALDVRFGVNTLSVGFKNAPPLFGGKLHRPVKEEDCMWSLDGGSLIITLEKMNLKSEEWWSCVIEGHQVPPGEGRDGDGAGGGLRYDVLRVAHSAMRSRGSPATFRAVWDAP